MPPITAPTLGPGQPPHPAPAHPAQPHHGQPPHPAPPHPGQPYPAGQPMQPPPAPQPHPATRPPAAPRRRITGIDVARCLAILGMLVAHLSPAHHPHEPGWGEQWMWIFDGRSSALFATLAGVSIAIMGRSARTTADPAAARLAWRAVRVKIAVRAGIILPIGIVLQLLGTPVAVILPTYAVLFLMALPVLRLPTGWLLGLAAVAVTLGPVLVLGLRDATSGTVGPTMVDFGFGVGELVWGYYPALVWIGYLLVGMALGRGAVASVRFAGLLVAIGVPIAAAAYWAGAALTAALDADPLYWPDVLVSIDPHSSSPFEVIGNIGVALAVTGVCLLLTSWRPGEVALSPLAATGSMSLTVYTAQIVVIAILGSDSVWYPTSNVPLVALTVASIAFATIWRRFLGQGPMERVLKIASDAAARAAARPPTPPAAPPGWPR